jgi:hypothetical protein
MVLAEARYEIRARETERGEAQETERGEARETVRREACQTTRGDDSVTLHPAANDLSRTRSESRFEDGEERNSRTGSENRFEDGEEMKRGTEK